MASHTALTATEWNELHTVIQEPPKLKSHFAQMILELTGDYAKAVRADQCGLHARVKAKDGCTQTICYHCMQGFCDYCAGKLAKRDLETWYGALSQAIQDARAKGIRRFTLVTVLQGMDADKEALRLWFRMLNVPGGETPHFTRMRGYVNGCADCRILCLNDRATVNDWQELYPHATVKVWYFPIDQLHKVFRDQLFESYLPRGGEARGRQEVLFDGMHRFEAVGIKIIKNKGKIAGSGVAPANLAPDSTPNLNCGLGKCPHGFYFCERTAWFSVGEVIPIAGLVEYERVPPLPIQH